MAGGYHGPSAMSMDVLVGAARTGVPVRVSVFRSKPTQPDHYIGRVVGIGMDHGGGGNVEKLIMSVGVDGTPRFVTITMGRVGAVALQPMSAGRPGRGLR
jgi:hypothetical protein